MQCHHLGWSRASQIDNTDRHGGIPRPGIGFTGDHGDADRSPIGRHARKTGDLDPIAGSTGLGKRIEPGHQTRSQRHADTAGPDGTGRRLREETTAWLGARILSCIHKEPATSDESAGGRGRCPGIGIFPARRPNFLEVANLTLDLTLGLASLAPSSLTGFFKSEKSQIKTSLEVRERRENRRRLRHCIRQQTPWSYTTATGRESGKAGARFEACSQDIAPAVLVGFRPRAGTASPQSEG